MQSTVHANSQHVKLITFSRFYKNSKHSKTNVKFSLIPGWSAEENLATYKTINYC